MTSHVGDDHRSSLDDGWAIEEPAPLPPPPPTPLSVLLRARSAPTPTPAPRLEPPTTRSESPRGKRRLARGTDPTSLLKRHGLRRVVAQPGQFADRVPLPGVTPLPTPSAVVAAKILATFPAHSEAADVARTVIANANHNGAAPTIESSAPRRRDLTPRTRMAALHRFGAVCYISAQPTRIPPRPQTARLPAEDQREPAPTRRRLWKRIFGS